jgi:LacI family transcriptional regulator
MTPPTIIDVAKRAGVSTTTVSHFINGTRFISEELRVRVENAINELGYHPNSLARGLRRGESKTIGLIVPDNSNSFFAEILRAIESIGHQNGYSVILCNSDGDIEKEVSYTELLYAKQVDGIVFITTNNSIEHLQYLSRSGIPIVVVDRDLHMEDNDVILVDNFKGGYDATQYLIQLGHKKIACITGPSKLTPSADRVGGYQKALEESNIKYDPEYVVIGDFQVDGGEKAMQQLLSLLHCPSAVFVCNDMMALGAMRAIRKASLTIPDDISLIGFDDIPLTSIVSPALTTVAQPINEIAQCSFDSLISRMQEKSSTLPAKRIILPTKLVIRESCKRIGTQ